MDTDRVHIKVSPDGLKAEASIRPGKDCTISNILVALDQAGVTFGIDARAVEDAGRQLANPKSQQKGLVLARGIEPIDGTDAEWLLSFAPSIQPGTMREDGTFDCRHRHLFTAVEVGDVLAKKRPATAGREGTTVTGRAIPARSGRDISATTGDGAIQDENGVVRAVRDGVIKFVDNRLFDVVDFVVHAGDVDLRSGNLSTGGSLQVNGTVTQGMTVNAGGDIVITGDVDGGRVISEGNTTINGDLVSREGATLSAEGSGTVRRIQNSTVQCGHLLVVQKDVVSSDVAAREIQVAGHFVGGVARAETRLEIGEAGSAHCAATVLQTAEPIVWPIEVARATRKAAAARRAVRYQATRGSRSYDRVKGGKISRQDRALKEEELARLDELRKQRAALLSEASISARLIHSGTTLRFGIHERLLDVDTSFVRFRFDIDSGEVVMEPFR